MSTDPSTTPDASPAPRSSRVRPSLAAAAALATVVAAGVTTGSAPLVVTVTVALGYLALAWRAAIRARAGRAAAARIAGVRHELDLARGDLRSGAPARDVLDRLESTMEGDAALGAIRHRVQGVAAVSQRLGVAAADLIERLGADERAAARVERVTAAHTSAGTASARLLAALPLGGLLIGETLGAEPVRWLTGSGAGAVALVVAAALHIIGLTWAARVRRSPGGATPRSRPAVVAATAVVAVILALTAVFGPWALASIIAAPTAVRALRRQLAKRDRAVAATAAGRSLPFALDVAAACLRAGAPAPVALWGAAAVAPGLVDPLRRAASTLRFGGDPGPAFASLPAGDVLARTFRHSARTGAGLADAIASIADDLRLDHRANAEEVAARSGVWLVLPLCVCFLPAFIVGGLVPIVASVLGRAIASY